MTDFAKPATPQDALRRRAEMVEYTIKAHEQKIREHQVIIEALRHEWGELLNDADRYERYQPAPQSDATATPDATAESTHFDGMVPPA